MTASEKPLPPFSVSLDNPLDVSRLHRPMKSIKRHNDTNYQTHLLLLETNIRNGMSSPTSRTMLIEYIIELQTLIFEGEEGDISEELLSLAKQVYFKAAAELLYVNGPDKNMPLVSMLCSLSYQSVACITIDDPCLSGWSAYMTLDALTLFQFTYRNEGETLWLTSNFGDLVVDALVPAEGAIKRLHARVFQEARENADYLVPTVDNHLATRLADKILPIVSNPEVLKVLLLTVRRRAHDCPELNHVVFFSKLFSSLPRTMKPDSGNPLGAEDVALFLVTMATVSLLLHPALVVGQVHVSCISHWKAICASLKNSKISGSANAVLTAEVAKSVRLISRATNNLKVLYSVYKWMLRNEFPNEWVEPYAALIREHITGVPAFCKESLFDVPDCHSYSATEEEIVLQDVNLYLARRSIAKGLFREADVLLSEIEGKPDKNRVMIMYELYSKWNETELGGEKSHIEKMLKETEKLMQIFHPSTEEFSQMSGTTQTVCSPRHDQEYHAPPEPKEQMSFSEPISITSPVKTVENIQRPETPSSPYVGDSSFLSAKSGATRDYGTSTDNSFVSAVDSPYRSEGDRTPTTILSPSNISPRSAVLSPPEEPIHRSHVEDESFAAPETNSSVIDDAEEESYLMEFICRKINNTTITMNNTNKSRSNFADAVSESRLSDMELRMKEMQADYEDKLAKMQAALAEAAKSPDLQAKPVESRTLMGNLSDPRQILRDKVAVEAMKFGFLGLDNSMQHPLIQVTARGIHPNHSGVCLGCLSDDEQEKALGLLTKLSQKWNEEGDD